MPTPESRVKKHIKDLLDKYESSALYYYMPVPGGYGRPTLDYIGAFFGRAFAIEAKAPGKKPTARQLGTIDRMIMAGVAVFVVDGEPGLKELRQWLEAIQCS